MNRIRTVFFLLLGLFATIAHAQDKATISGYLKDNANGESLIGATVIVKELNAGSITNVYGFYSITVPPGDYTIEYRYIGYTTVTREVSLLANQEINIELEEDNQELAEVVILGEALDQNVTGVEMSVAKLDVKTIQKIPAFLGEADVIKSIQLLPGVSTVGEGASGFNVRGGSVGQNLVLLDDAPVYNSSHLLGLFSVFNPDAVSDIKLYKGGIPARYGGRIASILDVRMKEGNSKKFSGTGGIGTIFARGAIEGPIVKDKASFIIAGRRSYGDILARPFTDVLQDGAALNFWDLTAKANATFSSKDRLFISGYWGRDKFKFDARQGFSWGNRTGTVRWNHLFNQRLFANFTGFFSDYDYSLAFGENDLDKFEWDSRIRTTNFKPELTYFINTSNELTFGGEIIYYRFDPANAVGVSGGDVSNISLDRKYAFESSLFLGNEQKLGSITMQYGLRVSDFRYMGPGNVYSYESIEEGARKEPTFLYRAAERETIQDYFNWEPRFSIKAQINPASSVKASYNRTAQYIHLISNTTASNPLDVWTPSTNNIKPQLGDQVALGYFRNFGKGNDWETSAEVYYRDTQNQIEYIDGADLLINEFLEGELLAGVGRAYGLELYAKRNTGRLTGWVSYTLARSELKVEGINNNEWYPARYDQLHNLKIAGFYELNDRWTFSANFSYISGTPTTFPTSRFTVQDYTIPYNAYGSRNNIRIPDFHRLDIAATLYGKKIKKGRERKNRDYWVFSVYNVYNRRNPFSIYFSQGGDRPVPGQPVETFGTRVSIIGSFIPSISYNFEF